MSVKKYLGIELGSTRIKSILVDQDAKVLAQGVYEWKNHLEEGLWSYRLEEAWLGVQKSYSELVKNFGTSITWLDGIGISGMMHGYLALDSNDNLLVPFRTWQNTNTEQASKLLSNLFNFHIPMRWSVSHYYQSYIDGAKHVNDIAYLTTLAGYIHYKLTGEKVLGANDASGMFPLNGNDYDDLMIDKFNVVIGRDFKKLLPKVLLAGENAGYLTKTGALLLDPTGKLQAGISFCPPEGDMGTGMICTNSIAVRSGNFSAGTSANLTVVLQKPLKEYYNEIDIISTPNGTSAALVHASNCTSVINEWVDLFKEVISLNGGNIERDKLFELLFKKSLESDDELGELIGYDYLVGEPLANINIGMPMLLRKPNGKLNIANFMQMHIYSAISVIALGVDILKKENVQIDRVTAHGGFYKVDFIGQNATSAVLKVPVTVMENAGEGGAWGIALLASYVGSEKSLQDYLDDIFKDCKKTTVLADPNEINKFDKFFNKYKNGISIERFASQSCL